MTLEDMCVVASSRRIEVRGKMSQSAACGKNHDGRGLATRSATVLILGAIFVGKNRQVCKY